MRDSVASVLPESPLSIIYLQGNNCTIKPHPSHCTACYLTYPIAGQFVWSLHNTTFIFKDSIIPRLRVLHKKYNGSIQVTGEINDKMTVAAFDGVKVDRDNSIERLIDRCPLNL
ncbi:hypothetical protein CDAR_404411 [Caerostris darwini]|uniref:Uncharacterized protein n=1 Tax=Caerostris darwini TaxID=1538125 RepID=A0AAV4SP34_9ARAC|nr:hypothetical protein CDAR_404411 [Caerostris darwini]